MDSDTVIEFAKGITPLKVLKWSGVLFVLTLQVLAIILIIQHMGGDSSTTTTVTTTTTVPAPTVP